MKWMTDEELDGWIKFYSDEPGRLAILEELKLARAVVEAIREHEQVDSHEARIAFQAYDEAKARADK